MTEIERIIVRAERPEDADAIRRVHDFAFGGRRESALVDALRGEADVLLSFVAVVGGEVVGHVLFSPVTIVGEIESFTVMGLAPLAVLPPRQRRGIGSALVTRGLEECRLRGQHLVVVLGDPGYYHRFGFVTARVKGISCEYDVPDEAFMVAELEPEALAGRDGVARYRPEFDRP